MGLAQLFYSSGEAGFVAVDVEVPEDVVRAAEGLVVYEPPRDGRDGPGRADAARAEGFPKALSFSGLPGGGRLLSRSVYGGRWGRFHAHAVHLPDGARLPDGALPITAWESPRWADTPPEDRRPAPVDRFEPSGLLRREALVVFARSRTERLAPFFADLRALVAKPDGAPRLVVVERDSSDVAQWIALACAVLPREQAHRLTFTTYTRHPLRAPQQIVGALPSSEPAGHDPRFRVHDCTAGPAAGPVTDAWADLCARVWCAGRPDLFDAAADPGALAALALAEGVALRSDSRAAAAGWATEHASTLPEDRLRRLVEELSNGRPADGVPGESPYDEAPALAALSERIDGRVPTAVSAPLAARVLASAVLGRGPVPSVRPGTLTAAARAELARDLAYDLRAGIADTTVPATGRPLALLRVADLLDVDCQDELPEFAARLARAMVDTDGTPGPADAVDGAPPADGAVRPVPGTGGPLCPPALLDAVRDHPALRIALFGALDTHAATDPPSVARRLAGAGLPVEAETAFPHLRMCVGAGADPGGGEVVDGDEDGGRADRLDRFHAMLRTAGVSPHAEPAVLRTAFRLVWPDRPPTGREAGALLNQLGSDAHRVAGTRDLLLGAALAAPADDPDVPALATDLLRSFTAELRPADRASLVLLEYAGQLGSGAGGEDWVGRVLTLRDEAPGPVPTPVLERAFDALADRLLAAPAPESELYALARRGDPGLLGAYERAARADGVAELLRDRPAYVAACFCDWSAYPGTHPVWDTTRQTLLTKVLRPVVRGLSAGDTAVVEKELERAGRGKLDAFRTWNRPSALGRLTGRFTGRPRTK
ncbi:GTPase-associated protein 1-related protein [Streptomyces sp. NPDC026672]|uniref:GTPase-associated protein 1-related protein n=1 Tax=unclassified Streptomyces TaxID=2593676 RepID=UPI0033EC13CF